MLSRPPCARRMQSPRSISSTSASPPSPIESFTAVSAGFAPTAVERSTSALTFAMASSPLSDLDLLDHVVVHQPAILHAKDAIFPGLGEGVAHLVHITGHGLGLEQHDAIRVVDAKAVIHVVAGDLEDDGTADRHLLRRDLPAPLAASGSDDNCALGG